MDRLMTINEVAEYTRITEGTLRQMRYTGTGLGPLSGKIGRRIFWKERDVIEWVNAQFPDRSTAA